MVIAMIETLKMMQNIITEKEKKLDEGDLISSYKKTLDGKILAYFYVSNFGIISKIADIYTILDTEDKASFCLSELDKCLRNYDFNKNVKFISYFQICFDKRLKHESRQILCDKRKIQINKIDNDLTEMNNLSCRDEYFQNEDEILDNYDLTEKEKKHCKLLNHGYTRKDIAKMIGVTVQQVWYDNTKIRKKILNSF